MQSQKEYNGPALPELEGSGVEHCIEAAREGCPESLGRLLQLFRRYLVAVADRELATDLQGKVGASDVVQETLFEAQRDFTHFRGRTGAELLRWLRRILLHNVLNQRRRFIQTGKRAVAREVVDGGERMRACPGAEQTPSEQAVRREQEILLQEAMSRLPAEYRVVLRLRHQEGRSFSEIGQLMDRSADAARMLWYRAFDRLANQLGKAK